MTNLTKKEIKNTFRAMLDRMPLNQITVKALVRECGINRNSFYYHYQDIPALIQEIIKEESDAIISKYSTIDSMETGLYAVLDFASQNRRAILHIFNSVNRAIFEEYLWGVCDYVVNGYLKPLIDAKDINEDDKKIIIKFYVCECFGFAMDWLNHGANEDIQEQIKRFCSVHQTIFENLLKDCLK